MDIKQIKIEKNVASVEVVVTKAEVDKERDHAVAELATQVTVKGFRQGKAPLKVAQQHLNPEKVTDHVINHLLQDAVTQTLSENKYRLFGRPVLENIDMQGKDSWKFSLSFPLYPEFTLGDYKKLVKSVSKKSAPKQTKKEEDAKEPAKEDKMNKIYESLLKSAEIDIPQSVIDEEVSHSLHRLKTQAETLHLTLENYLKAVNRTLEQVKEEYAKSALDSLKLDLILIEIAKKENITVDDKEVVELAKSANLPENQYSRLRSLIERRKTLAFLSSI
jgi:FKBP-type peptidyl-prolyl cis-trans isomerase (trigger factor)